MSTIKYHYACDESNNLIAIEDVVQEYRQQYNFYCISCGAEMVARLGNKRSHHFAHKGDGVSCNSETYLHQLTKKMLKQKFYQEGATFECEYYSIKKCTNSKTCPFYKTGECESGDYEKIDLKKYYNTCTEEQRIKGFVADLLLFHNEKEYDPILIEIKVTHGCDQEKIDSGLKIIEIPISSENDIVELIKGSVHFQEGNIAFYGFPKYSKKQINMEKNLFRFILYQSGAAYVELRKCNEPKVKKDSLIELNIGSLNRQFDRTPYYHIGLVQAVKMGKIKRNCILCKYYKRNDSPYRDSDYLCCRYKKVGTPKVPKQQYANECPYYRYNKEIWDEITMFADIPIVEVL